MSTPSVPAAKRAKMDDSYRFRFSIDRGGTFCDVFCDFDAPGGEHGHRVVKLLSVDPANYPDAPREGIRRVMEDVLGRPVPADEPVPTACIESIRQGTTVATNALLERQGARTLLVITRGFGDVLQIGNQARPSIFDLKINKPDLLYEEVVEIDARMVLDRDAATGMAKPRVQTPVDEAAVRAELQAAFGRGLRSVAVVLMHSSIDSSHEDVVGRLAREVGFTHVSCSSHLFALERIVPRGHTACVDAYLTPKITEYMDQFYSGFDAGIREPGKVMFMNSDGGLTRADLFSGYKAVLSGPAGGVVGYARTTYTEQSDEDGSAPAPVIGFDMGGTSTDVSRYAGEYEQVFETQLAGVTIQAPQLDITTVAAGGGSRLFYRDGMFVVGPESAGAHPGPVCYKKGGHLAITDANLFLGRLVPDLFPKIFGPGQDEALDVDGCAREFSRLAEEIGGGKSADDVAYGFIKVANEAMCRPIRTLTEAKGHDTTAHILTCFGGAGGQHACAIARSLGMRKVFVHRFSGILSAYGLGLADVVHEAEAPVHLECRTSADMGEIESKLDALAEEASAALEAQGFPRERIVCERFLSMRYKGTDEGILVSRPDDGDYIASLDERYKREFGFWLPDRARVVDFALVRAAGKTNPSRPMPPPASDGSVPEPTATVQAYFEGGRVPTPVYKWDQVGPQTSLPGPCLIINQTSTVVVEPTCTARMTRAGDLEIRIGDGVRPKVTPELDPIQLSIFAHRFMSIAEQMGRTLQRTSVSTNIKERLDFSCALFGPDGSLVANAPHIPVHLGSMGHAVRKQIELRRGADGKTDLVEGDVLVTNHPAYGGSHLPDITVITPVFDDGRVVFFVANRGHHADIGGSTPGSMPPFSKSLAEEGACIISHKLVEGGVFQEDAITRLLDGTRNLSDNLSDLRAQVSANQRGIRLVGELIAYYGLDVVQAYMHHVQLAAETAVRNMLRALLPETPSRAGTNELVCGDVDAMDDGTLIKLEIRVDRDKGEAVFDFTGTGEQSSGNWNAPLAVTNSAIIYSLRCLVERDVPLNEGCMAPIRTIIPPGCLLSPTEEAAVVGGNVLTSQRITDVILRACRAAANSQGCCNNVTFGSSTFGCYETIAGGAGAGPTWTGQSGVHVHMTNTRITDAEVMERRYPVIIRQFSIRSNSGGRVAAPSDASHAGGDGVRREFEFLEPVTFSILSERRARAPRGICLGNDDDRSGDAQPGKNTLFRAGGAAAGEDLGGKNSVELQAGDRVLIETPGGGAFF